MPETDNPYQLDALAASGQWRALAAIIWNRATLKSSNAAAATDVMAKLADGTSDEAAFSELWKLLQLLDTSSGTAALADQLWATAAKEAPSSIAVPESLRDGITAFVTAAENDHPERHDPMRSALLLQSRVRVNTRRSWARQLLQATTGPPSQRALSQNAYALLAQGGYYRDRQLLMDVAEREQTADEQIRLLREIPAGKRTDAVHEAIAKAIQTEPLPDRSSSRDSIVREALAELPKRRLADVLSSDWATLSQQGLQRINLAVHVSLETLKYLCPRDRVPEQIRGQLLEGAHQRRADEVVAWGRWLWEQDTTAAQTLVNHLVDERLTGVDDEDETTTLRHAVNVLATEQVDPAIATALARLHNTAQLLAVVQQHRPSDHQLGHILAAACEQPEADVQAITDTVRTHDSSAAPLLEGFLRKPPKATPDTVANALFERAGDDPAAIRPLLSPPLRADYIQQLPTVKPTAAITALSLEDIDYTDEELAQLVAATHWQRTTAEQFAQALSGISARSDEAVIRLAAEAIESVDKPKAATISGAHHAALLTTLLDGYLGPELAEEAPDGVRILLQAHVPHEVRKLVCRWVRHLTPSEPLVNAVAEADEHTVGLDDEFDAVRTDQAEALLEQAQDDESAWDKRAQALNIATRANSELARQVALKLLAAGDVHIDLQLAAVDVLREAGLRTDDIEKAEAARDSAAHRQVREALDVLLQRVTSGTHAEALSNLFEMLRLDYTAKVDVLLPVESLRDGFQSAADKVRRDESGPADTYITQVTSLADHLMEMALVTDDRTGGTLVKRAEADKIAENAPGKPKAGQLAGYQNLQQELPWVVHVASLHKRRLAHANRAGSTTPPSFGPEDATWATMTLKEVVDGWVTSMHDMARRAEPGER